jgi:hypothetical protein
MGNNKKQAKSAAENSIIIIAVFLVLVAITLIASFAVAKANKIDITELVLNGDIELQVGEEEAVGFNVATAKTEDNDKVVAAVNRMKLVWTVEDESVAVYDDSEGVLRGVSEGYTVLTLATEDGKFSDSCTVTVVPAEAEQTPESAAATAETANQYSDLLKRAIPLICNVWPFTIWWATLFALLFIWQQGKSSFALFLLAHLCEPNTIKIVR